MVIFLYKTTNLVNGKFYYGIHTGPLEETLGRLYLGSGNALTAAVKKYGKENFKREVLEIFDDYESAYCREAEVVTEELVKDPQCYNLRTGGLGGTKASAETRTRISESLRCWKRPDDIGKKIGDAMRGIPKSDSHKQAMRKPKIMTTKQCHCGKIGSGANMTRYHFNNCKVKT